MAESTPETFAKLKLPSEDPRAATLREVVAVVQAMQETKPWGAPMDRAAAEAVRVLAAQVESLAKIVASLIPPTPPEDATP